MVLSASISLIVGLAYAVLYRVLTCTRRPNRATIICYDNFVAMPVTHDYLPIRDVGLQSSRDDIVEQYFYLGFKYAEILMFMYRFHNYRLSLRHLKRILSGRNLCRRSKKHDVGDVLEAVECELSGSGRDYGYRSMHNKLRTIRGIVTDRETVRHILRQIDPDGVESRRRRRLRRRMYHNRGPNYLWHIDGWDKLKTYGFCIHGGIDGFSRRILWLEVASTNKDPYVI